MTGVGLNTASWFSTIILCNYTNNTTLVVALMALKGSASALVVRVPTNEPVIIKHLLDTGFYNFLNGLRRWLSE